MKRTKAEAEAHFRFLMLEGIWMLARIIVRPKAAGSISSNWRISVLWYMDDVGNSSDEAKEYRRKETYAVITDDYSR